MKIVVCVKAVKSELVNPSESGSELFQINPYDLYVLEKCIELKKSVEECKITCLCMGPMASEYVLTKTVAMGADEAVLLNDKKFIGADTVATTYALAKAIEKIGNVDMVVCGEKAIDGETGQVVFGLSERLHYFCISSVECFECADAKEVIIKKKDSCKGITETIRTAYPVVLSFHNFLLNQPSINLLQIKRAKRQGIIILSAEDIGADEEKCGKKGSKTSVLDVKNELIKKDNEILDGSVQEKAKFVLEIIQNRN